MRGTKWIKLNIDMFDQWQIKELRSLPEGDTALVVYMYLLMQAVRSNQGGVLVFNEHIPITNTSIANQLGIKERTVDMGIQALIKLELLTDIDGVLKIVEMEKFKYTDPMEVIRAKDRERKRLAREKGKQGRIEGETTETELALIPVLKAQEEVILGTKQADAISKKDIKRVVDSWNNAMNTAKCRKTISRLTAGTNRYIWLKDRIKEYGIEDVIKAINYIPSCSFLLESKSKWFNFEWFVRKNNFPKVLDGYYLDPAKKNRLLEAKTEPVAAEEPKQMTDEEWLEMMRNSCS